MGDEPKKVEPERVLPGAHRPIWWDEPYAFVTQAGYDEGFDRLRSRLYTDAIRAVFDREEAAEASLRTTAAKRKTADKARGSGLTQSQAAKKRWAWKRKLALGGQGRSSRKTREGDASDTTTRAQERVDG